MTNQADKTSANAGQRGHTPGPWAAFPIPKDRLNRYAVVCVNDQHCPGAAKKVVACDIRTKEDADLIAAAPELQEVAISNAEYRAARDPEFSRGYNAAKNGQRRDVQKESADWYAGYDARAAISKATGGAL